jgi:Na+/melibiose symporter-like transporter
MGLLTDLKPIFGLRRKYYIFLNGILIILGWIFLIILKPNLFISSLCLFIISFGKSFSSVLGEAIVVELSLLKKKINYNEENIKNEILKKTEYDAKDFISMFFLIRTFGYLISSYLQGKIIEIFSLKTIFLITSLIGFLIIISGFLLIEKKIEIKENEYKIINDLIIFIQKKNIYIPLLFMIIFGCSPSYSQPLFYFITNKLKFTPSDLGIISMFSTLFSLIGIFIYKKYLKNIKIKKMLLIGTIILIFLSFTTYILVKRINLIFKINDFIFLLFGNCIISLIGDLVAMPILSLSAILCPKNLEGTVYSLFMSANNFGYSLGNLFGSFLTEFFMVTHNHFDNLGKLVITSNLLSFLIIPVILFINDKYFSPNDYYEKKNQLNE